MVGAHEESSHVQWKEQRHLLDLLSVQHDQFTLALRESMERMKEVERKAGRWRCCEVFIGV